MSAPDMNTDTAVYLLDLAQLAKQPGADAQTLGAIGAGYAILAAADRMAVLVESLEALAATVDGLAATVDAMAAPRPSWWRRILQRRTAPLQASASDAEPDEEASEVAPVEVEQAVPAPPVRTGLVITGPWTGAQS